MPIMRELENFQEKPNQSRLSFKKRIKHMTKTTKETDSETCSKCGEVKEQNRMHFSSRKSDRFTCQDCWEAAGDCKKAEQKDETHVHKYVN